MKNFIVAFAFAALFLTPYAAAQTGKQADVTTVPFVDLKKYAGKWYEIARYPFKYQKQCVGNTTATYSIRSADRIEVLNQCVTKDGSTDSANGAAKVADKKTNAKLKVRFAPSILSFIPGVWGDYWILDLDKDYKYVAVGDPDRKYLWILSRDPKMPDAVYQDMLRRLEKQGFNPGKLERTAQNVEVIKGAVIERQ